MNVSAKVTGAKELGLRLSAIKGTPQETLRDWQLETTKKAKQKVPRKTSMLAMSIAPGSIGSMSAKVVASADYAAMVEFGTKPHVILPKYAKVLAWNNTGSVGNRLSGSIRSGSAPNVFARKVNHPGTKAQPFLYPAAKEAMEELGILAKIVGDWNGAA